MLECSLSDDGLQFIHAPWPPHAPSFVPQRHGFVGTRLEVEIGGNPFDGLECAGERVQRQGVGERQALLW